MILLLMFAFDGVGDGVLEDMVELVGAWSWSFLMFEFHEGASHFHILTTHAENDALLREVVEV
jgi:hypothetical protein